VLFFTFILKSTSFFFEILQLKFWAKASRLSLYVDDVVVFARPEERELTAVKVILACFGAASGPLSTMAKAQLLRSDATKLLGLLLLLFSTVSSRSCR
jgi:hypothetical protein